MIDGRTVARIAALGFAPLLLSLLNASPVAAHGSMNDPVSRVSGCFAEGPESPQSAACKAAVKASGTQAFYDWNEVNIPDAAGRHKEIIPDGKLCSAGREKYKGLDLPRADWPASALSAGAHTFSYKATAPHKGTFSLYITKDGYDPSEPLAWSDLEAKPFAEVTDPQLTDGQYVFEGKVPKRTGRHLVYSVWQRSDSPEAFYTCSDVTFGGKGAARGDSGSRAAASGAQAPAAPSDRQIADGAGRSTVDHGGHGAPVTGDGSKDARTHGAHTYGGPAETGDTADAAARGGRLAETGGDGHTATLAMSGAGVLAVGTALLLVGVRRRVLGRHRG